MAVVTFDIDGVDVNLHDFVISAQDILVCKAVSSNHLKPGDDPHQLFDGQGVESM